MAGPAPIDPDERRKRQVNPKDLSAGQKDQLDANLPKSTRVGKGEASTPDVPSPMVLGARVGSRADALDFIRDVVAPAQGPETPTPEKNKPLVLPDFDLLDPIEERGVPKDAVLKAPNPDSLLVAAARFMGHGVFIPRGKTRILGRPIAYRFDQLEELQRYTGLGLGLHPGNRYTRSGADGTPMHVFQGEQDEVWLAPAIEYHGVRGTRSLEFFERKGKLKNFYGGDNEIHTSPNLREAVGFSRGEENHDWAGDDQIVMRVRGPRRGKSLTAGKYRYVRFSDIDQVTIYTKAEGANLDERKRRYSESFPSFTDKFVFKTPRDRDEHILAESMAWDGYYDDVGWNRKSTPDSGETSSGSRKIPIDFTREVPIDFVMKEGVKAFSSSILPGAAVPRGRTLMGRPIAYHFEDLERAQVAFGRDIIHPDNHDPIRASDGTLMQTFRGRFGEEVFIAPAVLYLGVGGADELQRYQRDGRLTPSHPGEKNVKTTPYLAEAAERYNAGELTDWTSEDRIIIQVRSPKGSNPFTGSTGFPRVDFSNVEDIVVYTDTRDDDLNRKKLRYRQTFPALADNFRFIPLSQLGAAVQRQEEAIDRYHSQRQESD